MKICFPVTVANGIESEVYGHFGSAPAFVFVETESNAITALENSHSDHEHGACNPLKTIGNQNIDALVVSGIGYGALSKLHQAGIKVFQALAPTVQENITMLKAQNLPEFTLQNTCAGHGHGGGCGH